jgi:hypothetical protein
MEGHIYGITIRILRSLMPTNCLAVFKTLCGPFILVDRDSPNSSSTKVAFQHYSHHYPMIVPIKNHIKTYKTAILGDFAHDTHIFQCHLT